MLTFINCSKILNKHYFTHNSRAHKSINNYLKIMDLSVEFSVNKNTDNNVIIVLTASKFR